MVFLFISPNFPSIYSHFVKCLNERGVTVLGIGDNYIWELNEELKTNLREYCYVSDLSRLDWLKNTVDYLKGKYGQIDYLESNNEYWLLSDAKLREYANVPNGILPKDMDHIKFKSKMKEYFMKAGVKVARFILVTDFDSSINFINQVGYPVFAKPDNGVGASKTYKIDNYIDLLNFHKEKPEEQYIMEEYLDGYIVTFDGISDENSNVAISFMETFPTPIAQIVNEKEDLYYYAETTIPLSHKARGESVVKSFNISKRCFHIEFFVLNKDKEGLGKKGEFIGLEVNMRCPGGNTPDLLSLVLNGSFYDAYSDIIVNNKTDITPKHDVIAISVSRHEQTHYKVDDQTILNTYKQNIKSFGSYPPLIASAMGDRFYFAEFKTKKEALEFKDFLLELN